MANQKVKITIDLAPSLREKVKRKAAKSGTSTAQIVRDLLQKWVRG